jgi:hypothetical protein
VRVTDDNLVAARDSRLDADLVLRLRAIDAASRTTQEWNESLSGAWVEAFLWVVVAVIIWVASVNCL